MNIAKPHGSINWFITFNRLIERPEGTIAEVAHAIYTTKVSGDNNGVEFDIEPINSLETLKHTELVRSAGDYSFPAIIPPVAGYKQYNQFDFYQRVQDFTRTLLRDANELVIIGCSLREEDELLLNILDEELKHRIDVKIVARSSNQEVANKIRDIRENAAIDTSHRTFTEYARTL